MVIISMGHIIVLLMAIVIFFTSDCSADWFTSGSGLTTVCDGTFPLSNVTSSIAVSNAVFINCPPIIFNGSSLTLTNVAFISPRILGNRDFCISVTGFNTNVNFNGVSLTDFNSNGASGRKNSAFLFQNGALVSLVNFSVVNGSIINPASGTGGVAFSASTNCVVTWSGGGCFNTSSTEVGGCFVLATGSYLRMDSTIFMGLYGGKQGGVGSMTTNSIISMVNVTVNGVQAGQSGGVIYSSNNCTITAVNSSFQNINVQRDSGLFTVDKNSFAYIDGIDARNINVGTYGPLARLTTSSFVTIVNSRVQVTSSVFGSFFHLTTSYLTARNCSFLYGLNTRPYGYGGIYGTTSSNITVQDCVIGYCKSQSAGSAIYIDSGFLNITGNTLLHTNYAPYGAAVGVDGDSTAVISGNVQFTRNVAPESNVAGGKLIFGFQASPRALCGAGLYVGNAATATIIGPGVSFFSNSATLGQDICVDVTSTAAANNPNCGLNLVNAYSAIENSIYISELNVAKQAKYGAMAKQLASGRVRTPKNKLYFPYLDANSKTSFHSTETLPFLTLKTSDYFNQSDLVDYSNMIVAQLMVSYSSPYSSYSVPRYQYAAIFSANGEASFAIDHYRRDGPGTLTFSLAPLVNTTLKSDPDWPYPSWQITIRDCDPANEQLASNINGYTLCLPIRRVDSSIRILVLTIGIIIELVSLISIIWLSYYKQFQLIKGNSYPFLFTTNFGALVSNMAPILSVALPLSNISCKLQNWLEFNGTFLLLFSLIVKTFRILRIFSPASSGKKRINIARLSDQYLLLQIIFMIMLVTIYLALWEVINPVTLDNSLQLNSFFTVDICQRASFYNVMIGLRVFVILVASYLAFSIRNVPSAFNESKFIAFAMYNWIAFSALLNIVAQYTEKGGGNISVGYVLNELGILIPNFTTVALLVTFKVYKCVTDPATANSDKITAFEPKSFSASVSGAASNNNQSKTNEKSIHQVSAAPSTPSQI